MRLTPLAAFAAALAIVTAGCASAGATRAGLGEWRTVRRPRRCRGVRRCECRPLLRRPWPRGGSVEARGGLGDDNAGRHLRRQRDRRRGAAGRQDLRAASTYGRCKACCVHEDAQPEGSSARQLDRCRRRRGNTRRGRECEDASLRQRTLRRGDGPLARRRARARVCKRRRGRQPTRVHTGPARVAAHPAGREVPAQAGQARLPYGRRRRHRAVPLARGGADLHLRRSQASGVRADRRPDRLADRRGSPSGRSRRTPRRSPTRSRPACSRSSTSSCRRARSSFCRSSRRR